ncbi:MAG: organic solvent ABC transporter substrate-binding protein [Flavobacteriaceae bacterium]|jgi:phospholipid/cholesterol/gamma-HCH transport system substrate-binding protein|nr:MAG: organic solvent ABC transporter substrate-binding protein [Flavobacteriaceae bacterium]
MKLSYEIKTALLVMSGIFLFIVMINYLKSNDIFVSDRSFFAIYEDVEGVSTGTPVTISGFNVGSVQDISFFGDDAKLLLKFRVENDFEFSSNSIAQIYETGLIGGKALAIIPVNGKNLAISGDTLQSDIAPGLTELVNDKLSPLQEKIESMVVSADSLLIAVNSVFDIETKQNLTTSIENFSATIQSAKKSVDVLEEVLGNNENRLNSIIVNADQSLKNFSNLSENFDELDLVIENLSKSSTNINSITSEIKSGNGLVNKVVYDEVFVESLDQISSNINLLLEDLRMNPKRYVHFSLFGKKNKTYSKE